MHNNKDDLASLATRNGWTAARLAQLFGYTWDEINPDEKSVSRLISKALADGDDPEWIAEMLAEGK